MFTVSDRLNLLFECTDLPRDPAWIREVEREIAELCVLAPKLTFVENGSIIMEFENGLRITLEEATH